MEPVSNSSVLAYSRGESLLEDSKNSSCAPASGEQASLLPHRSVSIPSEEVLPTTRGTLSMNPGRGIEYLRAIPQLQLARLLVDGELLCRENGVGAYERREPNCLCALSNGWQVILGWLKQLEPGELPEVTTDGICELHEVVAAHKPEFNPGEFSENSHYGCFFTIGNLRHPDIKYFDLEGLSEVEGIYETQIAQCQQTERQTSRQAAFVFRYSDEQGKLFLRFGKNIATELYSNISDPKKVKKILLKDKNDKSQAGYSRKKAFYLSMADHLTSGSREFSSNPKSSRKDSVVLDFVTKCITERFSWHIRRQSVPKSQAVNLLEAALLKLNRELEHCKGRDDLISAVCQFTREFQQLHPFRSANGRTCTLLLQYLLMAHGLPPAMLKSPESFVCCGLKKLKADLESAINDTQTAIEQGHLPGFSLHGYTTPADDEEYHSVCAFLWGVIND